MWDLKTYVIDHFVLRLDTLGPKEVLQWLLLLTVIGVSLALYGALPLPRNLPIDIAELMLSRPTLHCKCDVKRPACCHGSRDMVTDATLSILM
jgi:hypothetical protein